MCWKCITLSHATRAPFSERPLTVYQPWILTTLLTILMYTIIISLYIITSTIETQRLFQYLFFFMSVLSFVTWFRKRSTPRSVNTWGSQLMTTNAVANIYCSITLCLFTHRVYLQRQTCSQACHGPLAMLIFILCISIYILNNLHTFILYTSLLYHCT